MLFNNLSDWLYENNTDKHTHVAHHRQAEKVYNGVDDGVSEKTTADGNDKRTWNE